MLIAVLAIALLVGIVSAATISYFGQVKMTASVSQAVLVDGEIYPAITEQTADVAGGGSFMRCHWLQSQTSVPVTVQFDTAYDPALWDNEITTEIYEIFDEAYPASYTPPTTWDLLVTTLVGLQDAVKNSAYANKVIAVDHGDYSGGVIDITVEGIKLLSRDGPATTTLKGVKISANGVKVSGFTIKPVAILGETSCIYLTPVLSSIEISYNELNGEGIGGRGVLLGLYSAGASYTNVGIAHNKIHDLITGIYTNLHTGVINIDHNEIYKCDAGIGGATGATIEYNTFHDNGEAIGTDNERVNLVIRYNNFLGDDKVVKYSVWPNIGGNEIYAYNNWWGCDGIDVEGTVYASYMIKTDYTLQPGETDWFAIYYKFAVDIYPYTYTITTTVKPSP
jgi:hypothetical protein